MQFFLTSLFFGEFLLKLAICQVVTHVGIPAARGEKCYAPIDIFNLEELFPFLLMFTLVPGSAVEGQSNAYC
jgi:hypothetical protein